MLGDRNDSAGRIPHRAADHIKDLGYAKENLQQSLNGEWASLEDFYTCLLLDGNTLPYALSV